MPPPMRRSDSYAVLCELYTNCIQFAPPKKGGQKILYNLYTIRQMRNPDCIQFLYNLYKIHLFFERIGLYAKNEKREIAPGNARAPPPAGAKLYTIVCYRRASCIQIVYNCIHPGGQLYTICIQLGPTCTEKQPNCIQIVYKLYTTGLSPPKPLLDPAATHPVSL